MLYGEFSGRGLEFEFCLNLVNDLVVGSNDNRIAASIVMTGGQHGQFIAAAGIAEYRAVLQITQRGMHFERIIGRAWNKFTIAATFQQPQFRLIPAVERGAVQAVFDNTFHTAGQERSPCEVEHPPGCRNCLE